MSKAVDPVMRLTGLTRLQVLRLTGNRLGPAAAARVWEAARGALGLRELLVDDPCDDGEGSETAEGRPVVAGAGTPGTWPSKTFILPCSAAD